MSPTGAPDDFYLTDAFLAKLKEFGASGMGEVSERWPFRMAAAVLDRFEPSTLRPFAPAAEAEGKSERGRYPGLEQDATPVPRSGDDETGRRWRLIPEIRVEALYRLGTRDRMRAALDVNPVRDGTPVQRALDRVVGGCPGIPKDAAREDLAALLLVIRWLRDVLPPEELPDADACARAFARADLFAPFEHLLKHGFVGRAPELKKLDTFFWSEDEAAKPAIIFGVGGIGKTTLLGKFLCRLDQVGPVDDESSELPLVIVVLDLDKPTLQVQKPHTLVTEIAVQIGRQVPSLLELSERVRDTYVEGARRQSTESERRHAETPQQDEAKANVGAKTTVGKTEETTLLIELLSEATMASRGGRMALVVDTFEEAQAVGLHYSAAIFSTMTDWMRNVPGLRIIVSGRAGADIGPDAVPRSHPDSTLSIRLANLDQRSAVKMLRELTGASRTALPDDFLQVVAQAAKGNPLCLKLAARLINLQPPDQITSPKGRRAFTKSLKQERVQAYLVGRILEHAHGETLKTLIGLALLLRRITPNLIRDVLFPVSRISLSDDKPDALFDAIRNETAFFEIDPTDAESTEPALRFRPELRREVMSDVMEATPVKVVGRIDRLAIAFYDRQETTTAGAEALYHCLRAGDIPNAELERRWRPAFGPLLRRALPELPPKSRLWLAVKLRVAADAEALKVASGRELGLATAPQVERLLALGRVEQALALLKERSGATGGRIRLLEAQAQRMRGNLPAAETALWSGLAEAAEEGDVALWIELTLTLSVTLESWDRLEEALAEVEKAASAMPPGADRMLRMRAVLTRLRLLRKLKRMEEWKALSMEAAQMIDGTSIRALKRHPVLFQEALAELGTLSEELVTKGVEWLGLRLFNDGQRSALVSALGQLAGSLGRGISAGLQERIGADPNDGQAIDRILIENGGVGLGDRIATVLRESQHSGQSLSSDVLRSFRNYFREGVESAFEERTAEDVDSDTVGSLKSFAIAYSRRLRNAGSIDDVQFEAS